MPSDFILEVFSQLGRHQKEIKQCNGTGESDIRENIYYHISKAITQKKKEKHQKEGLKTSRSGTKEDVKNKQCMCACTRANILRSFQAQLFKNLAVTQKCKKLNFKNIYSHSQKIFVNNILHVLETDWCLQVQSAKLDIQKAGCLKKKSGTHQSFREKFNLETCKTPTKKRE